VELGPTKMTRELILPEPATRPKDPRQSATGSKICGAKEMKADAPNEAMLEVTYAQEQIQAMRASTSKGERRRLPLFSEGLALLPLALRLWLFEARDRRSGGRAKQGMV
jgi:hypothetical protein